ncbi:MAG: methylamine utilization protein [Thalassolituus sp.]
MLLKQGTHSITRVFFMLVAGIVSIAAAPVQGSDTSANVRFVVETSAGKPLRDVVITLTTEALSNSEAPSNSEARTHIMDQVQSQFLPHVLAIRAGDQVEFPNSDNIRHHVYSFSEAKPFEIRLYADKPEAPVSFATPGLVVLGCNIHDQMLGYIYVSPKADQSVVTDPRGQATVEILAPLTTVRLWHERLSVDESYQKILSAAELEGLRNKDGDFVIAVDPEIPAPADTVSPDSASGFGNSMRR